MTSVSAAATHVVTSSRCSRQRCHAAISRQEVFHETGLYQGNFAHHVLDLPQVISCGAQDLLNSQHLRWWRGWQSRCAQRLRSYRCHYSALFISCEVIMHPGRMIDLEACQKWRVTDPDSVTGVQTCFDDSASPMLSGTTQQRPTVPMIVIIRSRGRTRYRCSCTAFFGETNLLKSGTNLSGRTLSIPSNGTPDSTSSSFRSALPNGPLRIGGADIREQ